MSVPEQILSALREGGEPMKAAELAAALGLDKKEVDKAIKALVASGDLTQPKRCYYAPKA